MAFPSRPPVDSRRTRRIGRTSRTACEAPSPEIPARSRASARSPRVRMSWRTVESGGLAKRAIGMSSKPATAISSGTRTPARRSANRTPIAIESFAAKIAVGRGESRTIASPATWPDSSPKSPSISVTASGCQPRRAEGVPAPPATLCGVEVRRGARDEGEAPVAEPEEVRDHRSRPSPVVDVDRGLLRPSRGGVEEDDRERGRKAPLELPGRSVGRHDDDAVDAPVHRAAGRPGSRPRRCGTRRRGRGSRPAAPTGRSRG